MSDIRFLLLCNIFGLCFFVYQQQAFGAPQDMGTAAIMVIGQFKDALDNGAAAKDSKGFEFFGVKFNNTMEVGFGDAIKKNKGGSDNDDNGHEQRRRRRAAAKYYTELFDKEDSSSGLSPASLEFYNKFAQEEKINKRSAENSDPSSLSSFSSKSNE